MTDADSSTSLAEVRGIAVPWIRCNVTERHHESLDGGDSGAIAWALVTGRADGHLRPLVVAKNPRDSI
ncbi:MAG TPA: hypothetical protein VLA95_07980 [Gemmatimonadales bacterium]|nr:hypothetical protein [Gemmatimonadales bacterium]